MVVFNANTYMSPAAQQQASNRASAQQSRRSHLTNVYGAQQDVITQQQQAEDARRNAALADLDRGYASPGRMAGMENLYKANLGNQVAGLQRGFHQASQHSGLAAARRGRLGSSFDTQQQAGLQNGLRQDVMGAENESYGGLESLRQNDEAQHQALRRALLAGDPQTAGAFQSEAAGYGLQTQNILNDQRQREEERRRQQEQMSANYSTLGNVLSSAGSGVQNYYQYKGY